MPYKSVLTSEHKDFVCQKIAEFKQNNEIEKLVLERFGVRLHNEQIRRLEDKKHELIERLRKHWIAQISKVPIMQKRVRAERIATLYNLSDEITDVKARLDMKLKILAAAHSEAEGKTAGSLGNVYNTQINQFSELDDVQLKSRIRSLKTEIIKQAEQNRLK